MVTRRGAIGSLMAGTLSAMALPRLAQAEASRPNIVFIVCDDLNCSISPYAPTQKVVSPNFERLQAGGAMFANAFADVPACSPSRTAMLMGLKPTTSGIFVNEQIWTEATPAGAENVFGHFRRNGWDVFGTGKLFHAADRDLRQSDWSEYWLPERYTQRLEDVTNDVAASADGSFDFGPSEGAALPDVEAADWAVEKIAAGRLDAGGVLLALGLTRPHLPLHVPPGWFDLYPEQVEVPAGYWPGSMTPEGNLPDQSDLKRQGLRKIESGETADRLEARGEANDFLRAYYASISFIDAQVGRVIDALEARGLSGNTYVVVTSDHGFMLGEKRQFGKFDLREVTLQVPLFIAGPGIDRRSIEAPVSLMDLYPTLCSLGGLPTPAHCEGQDLAPAALTGAAPPRGLAISYYGGRKRNRAGTEDHLQLQSSVRTAEWRLIDYGPASNVLRRMADFGAFEAELYDHDPASPGYDPHEWRNLAEERADVVAALRAHLPPPTAFDIAVRSSGEGS